MADNSQFDIVGEPIEVKGDKGVVFICSRQTLTRQDRKSEFYVVKKIRRAIDGTQTGKASQVFIPVSMYLDIVKALQTLPK